VDRKGETLSILATPMRCHQFRGQRSTSDVTKI